MTQLSEIEFIQYGSYTLDRNKKKKTSLVVESFYSYIS